eukprot:CAMPEP_0206314476 /NCGR_PEP_ID=MMETSP0106_2-20121207/15038_1 /ASSEMBLY_ACC=CAM_ASM_000206 /TAXON_ID=81532 /ORGANISM="Acanthoeca-like sp., Strain 10tr" /LENGTH=222 /DNA_ID=CAMNT_0053745835 /DNA_START=124 /DNA_END=789 /DNA_ORIENTATION=-
MLPIHRANVTPSGSPARPSIDGLQARRSSPLRPGPTSPASRGTAWASGNMKVSPLRKARRSLNFQPELRREGAGCSVLESTLCLTGMLCILVFFTLYDFNYVPWAQEPQRPAAQRLRARQLVKTTQIPWRGSNISAYPDDAYMQHWEGKRCEMNQDANGVLPAVLVLGVHKGGSTALFQYLSTHGSIRPSYCKEAHFFDWKYSILKQNLKLRSGEEPSDKDA